MAKMQAQQEAEGGAEPGGGAEPEGSGDGEPAPPPRGDGADGAPRRAPVERPAT
jgi:hypothetical protein